MKDIRIFIASSKELNQERNELAFLVLAKEEEFAQRGLRVRLAKWEYVDPKMTAGRTEDRYLEEMYNCDAAMVIFKNIAGMYTREELDKALAREAVGSDRIKTHKILFCAEGKPDSDAAKLRASLPEENYGVYANIEELKTAFLALVDELVELDKTGVPNKKLLDAAPESHVRRITAFLAADDELMSDRNAFADTVLNLNELLEFRNLRVQLRFCGPELSPDKRQELVSNSEMGLVLYGSNVRAFGKEEIDAAYNRTCRGENPKKLYVFFRDDEGKEQSPDFKVFRDSFVDKLGHFVCQFGGPDSLRLSFLLSLERYAGETVEIYSTVIAPTTSAFVGREAELRKLADLLTPTSVFPAGRLPIVTGAGGTGKSELVRQYASQLRVQYPGGVFQVEMETRRSWSDAFLGVLAARDREGGNNGIDIIECLGLEKDNVTKYSGADVRNALMKRSRECGPILLVLDNVEHFEDLLGAEDVFATAFPAGFSERVMVNVIATARTCDVPLSGQSWACLFQLSDLSPESALELLFANKRSDDPAEIQSAKRVAELLGYRALFLRRVPMILNGVNKKSRIVCRTYAALAKVLEEDPLLAINRTATVEQTHLPSRLWELVQNNLSEWGLGEACIKLAKISSYFSSDGFSRTILRCLWDSLVYHGLEEWGSSEEVFDQAVDLLKSYNLFQSLDPIRMHRLDRVAIMRTSKLESDLEASIGKTVITKIDALDANIDDLIVACKNDPSNDELYTRLISAMVEKNQFVYLVNMEMAHSSDFAGIVSSAMASRTIVSDAGYRMLISGCRSGGNFEVLGGECFCGVSGVKEIDELEDSLNERLCSLEAWIDVQIFKAETIFSCLKDSFQNRFSKSESIYKAMLSKVGKVLMSHRKAWLARILVRFASLYDHAAENARKIPILDKAVKIYKLLDAIEPGDYILELADALFELAKSHGMNNELDLADKEYAESVKMWRGLKAATICGLNARGADVLNSWAELKKKLGHLDEAERLHLESLVLWPGKA